MTDLKTVMLKGQYYGPNHLGDFTIELVCSKRGRFNFPIAPDSPCLVFEAKTGGNAAVPDRQPADEQQMTVVKSASPDGTWDREDVIAWMTKHGVPFFRGASTPKLLAGVNKYLDSIGQVQGVA